MITRFLVTKSLLECPLLSSPWKLPLDPMVGFVIIDVGVLPLMSRLADRIGKRDPTTAAIKGW